MCSYKDNNELNGHFFNCFFLRYKKLKNVGFWKKKKKSDSSIWRYDSTQKLLLLKGLSSFISLPTRICSFLIYQTLSRPDNIYTERVRIWALVLHIRHLTLQKMIIQVKYCFVIFIPPQSNKKPTAVWIQKRTIKDTCVFALLMASAFWGRPTPLMYYVLFFL